MKTLVLPAILFSLIILITVPVKSQNVEIIKADTVFKGYDSGETSSVKIVNHGTSLIYNHAGKLYEMNASTYEPMREITLEEINPVTKFSVDENCKYIIYNTNDDTLTIIADYYTGKTIKILHGRYFMSRDYLFLLYFNTATGQYYGGQSKFSKIEFANLTPVDSFNYSFKQYTAFKPRLDAVRCVYNKNLLIIGTGGIYSESKTYVSSSFWYIVDFENDTVIDFGVWKSNKVDRDLQNYLYTSLNGKYSISAQYSAGNNDCNYLVFDSTNTYKYQILGSQFKELLDDYIIEFVTNPLIIDDRYLSFSIEQSMKKKTKRITIIYDLKTQNPIKIIDFDNYAYDYKSNKFIFSNKSGCLATLGLDRVPVQENNKLSDGYLVTYSNNGLSIFADKAQKLDISIMNLTCEIVESLNDFYLNEGSNTIPLNTQLANGLYFCIIKTPETTISRKFMVIK